MFLLFYWRCSFYELYRFVRGSSYLRLQSAQPILKFVHLLVELCSFMCLFVGQPSCFHEFQLELLMPLEDALPTFWVIIHVLSYPYLVFRNLMAKTDWQFVLWKKAMQRDVVAHNRSRFYLHDERQGLLPSTIRVISFYIFSFFCFFLSCFHELIAFFPFEYLITMITLLLKVSRI